LVSDQTSSSSIPCLQVSKIYEDVREEAYSKNANIGDHSNKVIIASMSKNFQYYQQSLDYHISQSLLNAY
jgi:hypothetical protein